MRNMTQLAGKNLKSFYKYAQGFLRKKELNGTFRTEKYQHLK